MLVDCRLTQNLTDITSELNTVLGTNLGFENRLRNYNEAWLKLVFEMIPGNSWLFLDNFEAWLIDDYQLINAEIRAFLNVLFDGNHGFRGVVLSQSEPEAAILNSLDLLRDVGNKLYAGLDEDSAIDYLRDNADSENGLDTAPKELLIRFLKEVSYIPQALNSLTGYLKSISGYTFAEFMDRENGFWAQFDEHEHNETDLEKGIRRTKALIRQQILKQSGEVKLLVGILSFFTRPVPREALEIFFENKAAAANPVSRLTSHNLAKISTGIRGTRYYELHAYFREQSRKCLDKFEDIPAETLGQIAGILLDKGYESYRYNYFNRAIALVELSEQILYYLVYSAGHNNLINDLAMAYMNKGVVLKNLGRSNEAVVEYDKAISIRENLVNEQNRDELANDLAMAYMNKGVALDSLGRLNEAVVEYDKSEKVCRACLRRNEIQVLPEFVKNIKNRIVVLTKLENWKDTAIDVNKAFYKIENYLADFDISEHFRQLIKEQQDSIIQNLRKVSPDKREEIYKHLGDSGDEVRSLVKDSGD